jgi:hypothetical protein
LPKSTKKYLRTRLGSQLSCFVWFLAQVLAAQLVPIFIGKTVCDIPKPLSINAIDSGFVSLRLLKKDITLCLLRLFREQQTEQLGHRPNRAKCVFLVTFWRKGAVKWEQPCRAVK